MKIRIDKTYDHLVLGGVYKIISPYSPLLDISYKNDPCFKTQYLCEDPRGHEYYSTIKAWWVQKSAATVVENDRSLDRLAMGQRWRWKQGPDEWIVEIQNLVPSDGAANCIIVQNILGFELVGTNHHWNFDSEYWEYLPGQDNLQ